MLACPEKTVGAGGYFASDAQYEQMQKTRRTRRLKAYLKDLTSDQRQHALEVTPPALLAASRVYVLLCALVMAVHAHLQDCQLDLRDVGIDPRDFR